MPILSCSFLGGSISIYRMDRELKETLAVHQRSLHIQLTIPVAWISLESSERSLQ
jgi:hypothetical protein